MRLRLTLAYDGSAYAGWQIQERPDAPSTIQGAVETALFALLGKKTRVFGAGRTDAGVHALGQVAHCDVPEKCWDWRKRLNSLLPADIRVVAADMVAEDFHARKSAHRKTYIYQFWLEPAFVAPLLRKQVWSVGRIDIQAIAAGLADFLGEHDFASFQNAGTHVNSTIREITNIGIEELSCCEFYGDAHPILRLRLTATGFLKQMARNIAGFLVAVGRHKLGWENLEPILAARTRTALPAATAPARGLTLLNVDYGDEL